MNYIVIDEREKFLSDIQTRMLCDERTIEILATVSSVDKLNAVISSSSPDAIVVSSNIVDSQESWEYKGISVVGYATSDSGEKLLRKYNIPSYGVVSNSKVLLNLMEGPLPTFKPLKPEYSDEPKDDEDDNKRDDRYDDKYSDDSDRNNDKRQSKNNNRYDDDEEDDGYRKSPRRYEDEDEDRYRDSSNRRSYSRDNRDAYEYDDRRRKDEYDDDDRQPRKRPSDQNDSRDRDRDRDRDFDRNRSSSNCNSDRFDDDNYSKRDSSRSSSGGNNRSQSRNPERNNNNQKIRDNSSRKEESSRNTRNNRQDSHASSILDKDKGTVAKKAKVVTVYSAKGGVGKTTLATELAVYLALTSSGRGRLRVCIVDYNIDFGDVRSVLGMPADGSDMSRWAMDIRERLDDGEDPKDIIYSKDEIKEYLQIMDRSKLRALLAPITHEDSMDIGRQELDIMLRNLIDNGGFDFIVCDTGNNTRDSSVYALEAADTILLVSTQDATAATCNTSSMEALQKYGLDLRKVRMVINNCMSSRITGISVKEVEEAFLYPCIARIPHDTSVIRANNLSVPIVYQANHEVTASIRKIVNYLLDKKATKVSHPKKASFFKSLFGGK